MSVDVRDSDELKAWLKKQPREVTVSIAVRSALRVVPLLSDMRMDNGNVKNIALPLFRSLALLWFVANYPWLIKFLSDDVFFINDASAADTAFLSNNVDSEAVNGATHAVAMATQALASPTADLVAGCAVLSITGAINSIALVPTDDVVDTKEMIFEIVDFDVYYKNNQSAPLWQTIDGVKLPASIEKYWEKLKTNLLSLNPNWHVWTDWYEARLYPDKFSAPNKDLELARAMIPNEIWDQGWEVVNPHIEKLIAEHTPKEKIGLKTLAKSVSPQPLIFGGKLDAKPNPDFDKPNADDDLYELPIRQRSIIRSIIAEISNSRNTPPSVVTSLQEYDAELVARGVQPILGLLNDHIAILEKGVKGSEKDFDWCSEAAKGAFERFFENDKKIKEHFPLDKLREQQYAALDVDEAALEGDGIVKPAKEFLVAVTAAYESDDLTTKDYFTAVKKMEELASVLSTMPKATSIDPGQVSPMKRFYARFAGFVKKTVDVLKKSDGVLKSETAKKLMETGQEVLEYLRQFLP